MTTGLGTLSPVSLVPGDIDGLEALARRLATLAEGAGLAAATVRALDAVGWQGEAAEAFRARRDEMPEVLENATVAFAEVAAVLAAVAVEIEDARRQVRRAQDRWDEAALSTRRWHAEREAWDALGTRRPVGPGLGPSADDPGAYDRLTAERSLDAARQRVRETTERAAAVVREAAAAAPAGPSWADLARDVPASYYAGMGESLAGLARTAWFTTPVAAVVDPRGAVEHRRQQAAGLVMTVTDPLGTLRASLDVETWRTDPARAAGRLVPDVVLSALSAGVGTAPTVARRVADPPQPWTGPRGQTLTPEHNGAADLAHARSAAAEPYISAVLRQIEARLEHGTLAGFEHRLKSADSFKEKLSGEVDDWSGPPDVGALLDTVMDRLRFTLVAPEQQYTSTALAGIAALQHSGFELIASKPRWTGPGYKGLNTTWWNPSAAEYVEVQFHTPDSFAAKQAEHPIYEERRSLQRAGLLADLELDRKGQAVYDAVSRPPGTEALPFLSKLSRDSEWRDEGLR